MRSLIRSRIRRDDAGAVIVFVALMMVVLLGMGALVIDVGQLYAERRELQNGADAAALAVAQDCAGGDCLDEATTADTYADDNAHDGQAAVDEVCGSGPGLTACATPTADVPASNWVKVTTVTPDDDKVDFAFAPILGHDAGTVDATAVAAWGAVRPGDDPSPHLLRVRVHRARRRRRRRHLPERAQLHLLPRHHRRRHLPGGPVRAQTSPAASAGSTARTSVASTSRPTAGSTTRPATACPTTASRPTGSHAEVLVPIFDQTNDLNGSNGEYHVAGFAGFRVLGYRFPGNEWQNGFPCGTRSRSGGTTYICGEFTQVVTTGEIGTGPDYGARAVQMIG